MKALLKRLQRQFDGAVSVRNQIDNFDGSKYRCQYDVYVADYTPFIGVDNQSSHTLQRDNLQLLKTDVKEQIANWCKKQAEEGGITDVDFEE